VRCNRFYTLLLFPKYRNHGEVLWIDCVFQRDKPAESPQDDIRQARLMGASRSMVVLYGDRVVDDRSYIGGTHDDHSIACRRGYSNDWHFNLP
jgi:hypothetical protein